MLPNRRRSQCRRHSLALLDQRNRTASSVPGSSSFDTNLETAKFIAISSAAGSIGGMGTGSVPNAAYGPSKAALNILGEFSESRSSTLDEQM
jgi:hypothetical protein